MTRTLALLALPFTLSLALAGCGETPAPEPEATAEAESQQDAFWAALSSHCGKAYAGRMVSDEEVDAEMRGADMAMHVRECSEREIRVPFHVRTQGGEWDRSRTWILTRTGADGAEGLRLKHDHRHEDGSEDAVTMYGGDTAEKGTARAQDFPVDEESVALFRGEGLGQLFRREGLEQSATNVWRVEVDPAGAADARFAYQLSRTGEHARLFRVEFDLTSEIEPPPAPWGH